MAGFPEASPKQEKPSGSAAASMPVPFPCLRTAINNKGPGRLRFAANHSLLPAETENTRDAGHAGTIRRWAMDVNTRHRLTIETCRSENCVPCRAVVSCRYGSVWEGSAPSHTDQGLVLLFTSLLAIPLARQRSLHALLLARLQVVGVTLYFLDDVLLLDLPLEPAKRVFQRLAFLYTNFCQKLPPPNLPGRLGL